MSYQSIWPNKPPLLTTTPPLLPRMAAWPPSQLSPVLSSYHRCCCQGDARCPALPFPSHFQNVISTVSLCYRGLAKTRIADIADIDNKNNYTTLPTSARKLRALAKVLVHTSTGGLQGTLRIENQYPYNVNRKPYESILDRKPLPQPIWIETPAPIQSGKNKKGFFNVKLRPLL